MTLVLAHPNYPLCCDLVVAPAKHQSQVIVPSIFKDFGAALLHGGLRTISSVQLDEDFYRLGLPPTFTFTITKLQQHVSKEV